MSTTVKLDKDTENVLLTLFKLALLVSPFVPVIIAGQYDNVPAPSLPRNATPNSTNLTQALSDFTAFLNNQSVPVRRNTTFNLVNEILSDTSSSSLLLMAIWVPYAARAFDLNIIRLMYGFEADVYVFAMVVVRTIWFVNADFHEPNNWWIQALWVFPLLIHATYMLLFELEVFVVSKGGAIQKKKTDSLNNTASMDQEFDPKYVMALIIATVAWNAGRGACIILDHTQAFNNLRWTYFLYLCVESALGLVIAVRLGELQTLEMEEVWQGSGLIYPIYIALQLIVVPYQDAAWSYVIISAAGACILLALSCVMQTTDGTIQGAKKLNGQQDDRLWPIVVAPVRFIYTVSRNLTRSDTCLQLLYLAVVAYLMLAVNNGSVWYRSTTQFHGVVRDVACPIYDLVEGNYGNGVPTPKFFFEITNDSAVTLLLSAIPGGLKTTGQVREKMRAFMKKVYPHIVKVCVGFSSTVHPGKNMYVVLSMLCLVYVAVFIVLQISPSVKSILDTPRFWGNAIVLTIIPFVVMLVVADADTRVWSIVLAPVATYTRIATVTYYNIVSAYCLLILLAVILHFRRLVAEQILAGAIDAPEDENSAFFFGIDPVKIAKKTAVSTVKTVEHLISPGKLCIYAAIFLLITGIISGSPFKFVKLQREPGYYVANPDYMAFSKTADGLSGISSLLGKTLTFVLSLAQFIIDRIDTCVRLFGYRICLSDVVGALFSVIMTALEFAIKQVLAVLNIISIPGINVIESFFESISILDDVKISGFEIMNVGMLDPLQFSLYNDVEVDLPYVDFIDFDFKPTDLFKMWYLYAIIIVVVGAKVLSSVYPIFAFIEKLVVSGAISFVISAIGAVVTAAQILRDFGYEVAWEFSASAWWYGLALLALFAGLAIDTGTSAQYDTPSTGAEPRAVARPYAKRYELVSLLPPRKFRSS